MLIRISLIVAIVAALAAGALNVFQVRDKIDTLITQRNDFHNERDEAVTERESAKKELAKTKDDLTQTQQQLADTKSDRDKAVADAAAQVKRADELADKLTKTSQERDDAQNLLAAYKATGLSADQVGGLNKALKSTETALEAVQEENGVLQRTVNRLSTQLAELVVTNYVVMLRSDLKGRILAVDPKWNFVVLNIGGDQGVLNDGELLVSRNGRLVAKVIVRSVQKDRSIANIVPGWQLGDVIEGDEVTPAHPAS
jgi:septal ring factor EnvC (AmiA/AmiB activator)